jgi:hypothetical protein
MHGPLANGEAAVGTNERGGSGSRLSGHGFALSGRRASLLKGRHRRLTPGNGAIGKNGKGVKTGNSDYAPTGNNVLTDPYLTANHTRPDSDMVPTLQEPLMLTNIIDGLASFLAKRIKGDINDMMLTRQKQLQAKLDSVNAAAQKAKPSKATGTSAFDYGILTGINASGSFTSKNQNKNFYGSLPVDVFFGAFATYHFNDRWGVNLQLRGLNPQKISGTYTHSNDSKKDTNQVLVMADARKVYTADAALHLVYKPIAGLSLKAGPVFGYTLKEANGNTSFQTGPLKKDSVYYANVTKLINATTYAKTLTLGLSTGASYEYGRFIFDAAYVWNFKGPGAGSTLGSYSANNGSFLFSIGFKLNKPKK